MATLPAELAADLDLAFGRLVAEHATLVWTVLARAVGVADADDCAQETFVRAYVALRRYPPARRAGLQPRPWLVTIALNTARNARRRLARRQERPLTAADDRPHPTAGPEQLAEGAEDRRRLAGALAELPQRHREAVVLRHVIGLSVAETAQALGVPEGTVKARVSRGLAGLRDRLGQPAAPGPTSAAARGAAGPSRPGPAGPSLPGAGGSVRPVGPPVETSARRPAGSLEVVR